MLGAVAVAVWWLDAHGYLAHLLASTGKAGAP
jgi:hypothetical protein